MRALRGRTLKRPRIRLVRFTQSKHGPSGSVRSSSGCGNAHHHVVDRRNRRSECVTALVRILLLALGHQFPSRGEYTLQVKCARRVPSQVS